MNSTLLKFAILLMCVLVSMLLLAACGGGDGGGGGKENIAEQTWDCMAENAEDSEVFETSMRMMFPAASNLEEAKEQFIYASSVASIEELKAGRDEACGSN